MAFQCIHLFHAHIKGLRMRLCSYACIKGIQNKVQLTVVVHRLLDDWSVEDFNERTGFSCCYAQSQLCFNKHQKNGTPLRWTKLRVITNIDCDTHCLAENIAVVASCSCMHAINLVSYIWWKIKAPVILQNEIFTKRGKPDLRRKGIDKGVTYTCTSKSLHYPFFPVQTVVTAHRFQAYSPQLPSSQCKHVLGDTEWG